MGLFLDKNTKTCKTEQLVFCRFQTMMTFLHREFFEGLGWKILDRRHEIQKPSSDIDHGSYKCLHKLTLGHSVEFHVWKYDELREQTKWYIITGTQISSNIAYSGGTSRNSLLCNVRQLGM